MANTLENWLRAAPLPLPEARILLQHCTGLRKGVVIKAY